MNFNRELLKPASIIAVGVSGGKDSMALLHYLATNSRDLGVTIKAICVNHKIRVEAEEECRGVVEFCKTLGVECKVYEVDALSHSKENKLTLEQSARLLRYECFEDAKNSGFCDYIATAHHLLDNVETVLMRLFRGTGIKGLCGISKNRDFYIRPLLSTSSEEILDYVTEHGIKYFEDKSNLDTAYTRNYLRHNLVPVISERFPTFCESIERLTRLARVDEEHFDKLCQDKLIALGQNAYGISVDEVQDYAVFSRLVRLAFCSLGVQVDVEDRHVELIKELVNQENASTLDMPYGVVVAVEYGKIVFYKKREVSFDKTFLESREGNIESQSISWREVGEYQSDGLCLDFDKVKGAEFRFRRSGDVFKRYKGGTKSLGDYLTDVKVPVRLRDELVVLAKDNEVFAIVGVEISDKAKIDENTKTIIKLSGGEHVLGR